MSLILWMVHIMHGIRLPTTHLRPCFDKCDESFHNYHLSLNPHYPSLNLPNSLLLSFILPSFQGTFQGHFTALCACRGTHGHEAHTPPSLLSVSMISVTRDIRTSVLINKDENLSRGLVLKTFYLFIVKQYIY